MRGTSVAAIGGLVAVLSGCGADAPTPRPSPDAADIQLIEAWIDAINARDADAAIALMADEVEVGQGTLDTPDEMREYVLGYVCDLEAESWEASGSAMLVTVRFSEPESGSCPRNFVDETAPVVFEVVDGEITRIPAGSIVPAS